MNIWGQLLELSPSLPTADDSGEMRLDTGLVCSQRTTIPQPSLASFELVGCDCLYGVQISGASAITQLCKMQPFMHVKVTVNIKLLSGFHLLSLHYENTPIRI